MVAKFTICASLPKVQGQDPSPMWFTAEVWGRAGEWIVDNLRKGDRALVTGNLRVETWTVAATGEVREAMVIKQAMVEKQWAPREPGQPAAPPPAAPAAPPVAATQPAYQQAQPPATAAPAASGWRTTPAAAPAPAAAPSHNPSSCEPPY